MRPIRECGVSYWDLYREGQINALGRVQKKVAKFANVTNSSAWKTVAHRKKIARICSVFKTYTAERAWKATGDRLQDHATRARMIMILKLGPGNKEQVSIDTDLCIGQSNCGTNCLQWR